MCAASREAFDQTAAIYAEVVDVLVNQGQHIGSALGFLRDQPIFPHLDSAIWSRFLLAI
jgi:hypothetical protein